METIKQQITDMEERLRQAMLASDTQELDILLSPELIFTAHTGQIFSKEDDLSAHRAGIIRLQKLEPSEQRIQVTGDTAIVTVKMQVAGTFASQPGGGVFRYTRVWTKSPDGQWQIINGHACMAQ